MSTHYSELFWSRWLGDELSLVERWRLRRHLAQCQNCLQVTQDLRSERHQFENDDNWSAQVAKLKSGFAQEHKQPALGRWAFVAAVALATVIASTVGLRMPRADLSVKGADLFTIFVKSGDTVRPLGSDCAPGDMLRARYKSSKAYLLVVGVDGSGASQALLPFGGVASHKLEDTEAELPGSWALDERPGTERFVAFFSEKPISIAEAVKGIETATDGQPKVVGANVIQLKCEKSSK